MRLPSFLVLVLAFLAAPGAFAAGSTPVASDTPVTVAVRLGAEWKINETARTWLSLYRGKARLKAFSRADVERGALVLPPLRPGTYRLRGAFFYCRKAAVSACLRQAHDQTLEAEAGGPKEIAIAVGDPR